MRLSLWFVLILAFAVGMGCAMVIRTLHFEAVPVVQQSPEPKTKILVATQTIPSGIEITADFVSFLEVPFSEVPLGALTSFTQVYRRQPALPIPAGCPICEDLLLPIAEPVSQATFVPTGSQLVTLDIVHVRQGDKVFAPRKPLATLLAADQPVDIRVVPRDEARGRLAEMKNEVLRTFSAKNSRNAGELILENATIYEIHSTKGALTLMLDPNEAAKLNAAAKKGHIRVVARQDKREAPESVNVENFVDSTRQSQPLYAPTPVSTPQEPSLPPNASLAQGLSPSLFPMESASIASKDVAQEKVQRAAPMPVDLADMLLPPVPASEHAQYPVMKTMQSLDRLDRQPEEQPAAALPELESEEKVFIRNDIPMVSFNNPPSGNFASGVSEQQVEPTPMPALSNPSPTDEPEQGFSTRPYVETIMGPPRVSQAIQFLPPGNLHSTRRGNSPEVAERKDSGILSTMTPLSAKPLEKPVMPSVIPTHQVLSEKAGGPGYSPFERRFEQRVFTVFQDDDDLVENVANGVIPTPPLLLKDPETGTQAE